MGFAVIENSVGCVRVFADVRRASRGRPPPLEGRTRPLASGWRDRDGIRNVTATVTREVLMMGGGGGGLYMRDVDALQDRCR